MATGLLKFIQFNNELAYPTCNCSGTTVTASGTCCHETLLYTFSGETFIHIDHDFQDGYPDILILNEFDRAIPQSTIREIYFDETNKDLEINFILPQTGSVRLKGVLTADPCCTQPVVYTFSGQTQVEVHHSFDCRYPSLLILNEFNRVIPQTRIREIIYGQDIIPKPGEDIEDNYVIINFIDPQSGTIRLQI